MSNDAFFSRGVQVGFDGFLGALLGQETDYVESFPLKIMALTYSTHQTFCAWYAHVALSYRK